MSNIPGGSNLLPGAYSTVETDSRGVSVPGGTRIAVIMGEGTTPETLITSALGSGKDGLNSTYTSSTGADGRHFRLGTYPVISNRTKIYKNGIPLTVTEGTLTSKFDCSLNITNGKIELQSASFTDLGGYFYEPLSRNVGVGQINNLTLVDDNAPPEMWTVKCIFVQRTTGNAPMPGTAKFIATGSVSGKLLDANGNDVIWKVDNVVVSNGVISLSIAEGATPFREGDGFKMYVQSGVLVKNDTLTAEYIPTDNINDPVLLQGMSDVVARHGSPSLDNNLSLGCQLAFANAAPAIMTVQTAPSMPRRTSYVVSENLDPNSTNYDDFIFPLPAGVTPDVNSNIHFFMQDTVAGTEIQVLPNKVDFYGTGFDPMNPTSSEDYSAEVKTFIDNGSAYDYTVGQAFELIATGTDGYFGRLPGYTNRAIFKAGVSFDRYYSDYKLKIIDAANVANVTDIDNIGLFTIDSVDGDTLYVSTTSFGNFTSGTNITFQIVNSITDVVISTFEGTDGYVDPDAYAGVGLFGSASVNFGSVPGSDPRVYSLKIVSPATNAGKYDIIDYDLLNNVIQIRKSFVTESGMRYEVVDENDLSQYVVISKTVAQSGKGLRITIVDDKGADFYDTGWLNALESLEKVECDIVVPLPKQTISSIFQNTLAHCKTMSNVRNRKERLMFCGAIAGLAPVNVINDDAGRQDAAVEDIGVLEGIQGENISDVFSNEEDLANYSVQNAFGTTYRCVYFYPDQIVVQAGTENVLIDGFYAAAAAAGYEAADVRIENPLTNKVLSGFTILRDKQYSTLTLEQLAQAGITVLQPVTGGGRVVWGITTSASGYAEEQEISIVFIRDRVAKTLRAGFQPFVGNPETLNTQAVFSTRATQILNALISQSLITQFKGLKVARDSVEPRQWNVQVKIQPTYSINWIWIKIAVGLI